MQLEDWLDDLCVRFIINLPPEELVSVERICFQVEEAQWFYEDFIRPLDPSLPSLSLKAFSLRIFQHCPLFSTWSMHHYSSAFAEFLAYKQRVPVRGAIMLNEDMDEVVLVKGWKKGANWSFPRGKINKDENDLICAIREVYEETGYDIQTAGLVKHERDMKYIEVTMREQHMRLYVFRGVPKDTHFEPRTRKEISKIKWYKLTDLPTLKKKNIHHDGQEENPALNANKFYMVAPFLNPLKKWITQQKKKENRYSSSHLAAPPLVLDESATEGEPGPATSMDYQPTILSRQVPSSLPEVATVQSQLPPQDPAAHLKLLLNIDTAPSPVPQVARTHTPDVAAAKSNALLSLLRNGSIAEMQSTPQTPPDPEIITSQPPVPRQNISTQRPVLDVRQQAAPYSQKVFSEHVPALQSRSATTQQRSLLDLFAGASIPTAKPPPPIPISLPSVETTNPKPTQAPLAPYQRTGDPEFSRDSPEESRAQVVPPATALPTLTQHTRALLDAFKTAPPVPISVKQTAPMSSAGSLPPDRQSLLDAFKTKSPVPPSAAARSPVTAVLSAPPKPAEEIEKQPALSEPPPNIVQGSSKASSLLDLFRGHGITEKTVQPQSDPKLQVPAELSAAPFTSPKLEQTIIAAEPLSALFRKDAPKRTPQATKAGETAATVDGPLNQPHFDSVGKSPSQIPIDRMGRSPVPAHRTLFDPRQPTPTKILQRGDEKQRNKVKSPRPPRANLVAPSPKQKPRAKPEKQQFQPQILKRPQNSDVVESTTPSPPSITHIETAPKASSPPAPTLTASPEPARLNAHSPPLPPNMSRRTSQQTDSQKQNLLSLLTGHTGSSTISKAPRQTLPSGAVSPLTPSQLVSPMTEDMPISTRSRVGSLASITSAGLTNDGRQKPEKRQTTAGDKAFLLGYLGRIASQESHPQ